MDIRQAVTDQIIQIIEQGLAKGETMWDTTVKFGLPTNYQTKRPYSGINILTLTGEAVERGFSRNEWLTFKQAQALGAKVNKGAKGVLGVFFKMADRKEPKNEEDKIPILSPFWVFNVDEITGLPEVSEVERFDFDPIDEAERILTASGASITWQGARAFYRPATDEIYMPDRDRFSSSANAYAVALHELTHWTGHASRMNRDYGKMTKVDRYAFEELVAELGAAYLVAHLGIKGSKLENHADYLQHYLTILKEDKSAIFTAARMASQAFDFILKLTNESANESCKQDGEALAA
jgi:antirestriction protein ArdC